MIRSGLDWSGDAGDTAKPGSSAKLITVIAHIDEKDLDRLHAAFDRARYARRLPSDYCFKYSGSRPAVRAPFFGELSHVPITAHAIIVDKREWSPSYIRGSRGRDRINDSIIALVSGCPDHIVADQVLLIDAAHEESVAVRDIRDAFSSALTGSGRRPFARVKPCPDHRLDGAIIQVADMIAGALRDTGGVSGPLLTPLRSKIVLI